MAELLLVRPRCVSPREEPALYYLLSLTERDCGQRKACVVFV